MMRWQGVWQMGLILALVLVSFTGCGVGARQSSGRPGGLEPCRLTDQGVELLRPAGWKVSVENGAVFVRSPADDGTQVFFCPLLRPVPGLTALSFVRFAVGQAEAVYESFAIESRRANQAGTLAEVRTRFVDKGRRLRGFYIVSVDQGRGLFCGYEAPEGTFEPEATLLKKMLPGFRINPQPFDAVAGGGGTGGTGAAGSGRTGGGPTIDPRSMVVRQGTDGSMFITVPPDWKVGGGNYALAANPPDNSMGVFMTNDHSSFGGDPGSYFQSRLIPFLRCSNVRVTSTVPEQEVMQMAAQQGLQATSVRYRGSATSAEGMNMEFAIVVSLFRVPQYGSGWTTCAGTFARPELFGRNQEVLEAIVRSISPNQAVLQQRQRENSARLAQISRTISETGDIVASTLDSHRQGMNRIIDKYNYHLAGEEARYSQLENRIYVVDQNLSSYASNPNYPQEMLSNVPDDLWNRLPHERPGQ